MDGNCVSVCLGGISCVWLYVCMYVLQIETISKWVNKSKHTRKSTQHAITGTAHYNMPSHRYSSLQHTNTGTASTIHHVISPNGRGHQVNRMKNCDEQLFNIIHTQPHM